jgi:TolA-binding protein
MVGRLAARLNPQRTGFLLLVALLPFQAFAEWQIPEATIRYKVSLERKPTQPSAGYFIHLPDGGVLHGTTPATVVMTEDGKTLPSYLLWHNPASGFSLVFADPGDQSKPVYVYIQPTKLSQSWRPDTGLTPSAILCSSPGRDTLSAAQALGKFGPVDPAVSATNAAGIERAPLSIGGDLTGRPRPGVFYLLAYLNAPVNGSYWIAPFIRNGQCQISIDGNQLYPKDHSKAWGGTGQSVDLTAGLHRFEIFQTGPGTGPYSSSMGDGGLMFLAWRPPKEILKKADARVVRDAEIVRSGFCSLTDVEAKDGSPVAAGKANSGLVYWFENEEPLLIYDLTAFTEGQPKDATYTWTFPEGATLEGPKVQWIFPGFREATVKLTVTSGKATSSCVIPFFGFGVGKTDLQLPAHREAFRNVLTKMLEAYPKNHDAVANWSDAWLNNTLRTVEAGEGYPLLQRLFSDHFETIRRRLSPEQLATLEDLFLDEAQHENPHEALQWLQKFETALEGSPRQYDLKLREGEMQMYYLGDRKQAEAIFTQLAASMTEYGERAKIRLGDLAFLGGDLNKATALYADVQNRARARRNATPGVSGQSVADQFAQSGAPKPAAPAPSATASAVIDLKGGALQEVSLSENVRSLLDDGYLLEARQALGTWEQEFPLSKISSDYILRESGLYMKMGDWKRAEPMLAAYCREIDASSYLPDAASMLITCVKNAKEPPDSIREIIEKVKGRLKYHPVAAQLEQFLSTASKK